MEYPPRGVFKPGYKMVSAGVSRCVRDIETFRFSSSDRPLEKIIHEIKFDTFTR